MIPAEQPTLLTIAEVAESARVSKAHIERAIAGRLAKTPKLTSIRIGNRVLIRRESLTRWLAALETEEA
jgi:excisionase family DNA binding protein